MKVLPDWIGREREQYYGGHHTIKVDLMSSQDRRICVGFQSDNEKGPATPWQLLL